MGLTVEGRAEAVEEGDGADARTLECSRWCPGWCVGPERQRRFPKQPFDLGEEDLREGRDHDGSVLEKAPQPLRYGNHPLPHGHCQFVEKLTDGVGLYLNPPEHALVFCADEKSRIQTLDRTQKSLPIYPGRCGTMTHDSKRHGTTTLFRGD